ncbi:MAG: MFS transporter [Streptosporangiales bacterium]|nr:MFS transporter [Streptosporangiales bacterium]
MPRGWAIPLKPQYLVATLALWTGAFMLLFGNYGLSAWTPNVMVEETGGFQEGFSFGAALHSVPFLGGIACGWLADRWLGKRTALALWAGLGALTTLSIAFSTNALFNFFAVAAAGFFIIGSQFMINNICAMTYPVQARSTGVGLMLGVGRLGAILGPYLGGALIGAFGNHLVFIAVAVAAACVMLAAYFVIPKPTGVPQPTTTTEEEVPVSGP